VIKKLKHLAPNKYEDDSQGLQRFPNQIVNHIYPDPDEVGVIWIAGTKGLYKYDENIDVDFTLPFKTIMNRVSTGDSIIFHGFYSVENETGAPSFVDYQPDAYIPTLSYSNNNIKFEFSSSAYTYEEKNTYSYYLKGVDESWSNWNRRTQKEYSNLAPGKYIFQLKSKNLYGTEGKPTSYTFIIEAPWYLTTWAKIFFIVAGLLGIWVIVMLYNYRLRKHRKHLKLLVADRTFEVLSQKKEIELQYKKLSEQTEELKLQSEQIELKNRELEESQEEVLQINDTLEELNKQLEKKVEKRTAKIKLTLEKLKQTNKELDTFIYKASHDLKGPLSRILGLASLAKIETPSVKNIQYLDMIEHTSKDMDLLLSKLTQVHEIFNQHPKIVPLLVEEIIEEIKLKLNYLYSSEESEFVFNSTVNEPIYADHQLLYTVLFNLIENSLIYKNPDAQEPHQIKVSISKEGGQINIKIKDNGIGIKSDLLDAIFDMFYRASDRSKGSGLGLYLVKIAVEKMKGSIQVESTYLKHTTFNIKLPG
jgi:signal transduction histidine kinase